MAPGIFPLAISLRMKSPTRLSFSGARLDDATGGDSAGPATGEPAMVAANRSAAAATKPRQGTSVLHGFIDQLLERALNALAFAGRLLQQHEQHFLLAVDHHIAAAGAVPFQFANRPRWRWLGVARI